MCTEQVRAVASRVKTRRSLSTVVAACAAATLLLGVTPAFAAGLNFILDQSNSLPDGKDYMEVAISEGDGGSIDFLVTPLNFLTDHANRHFGIQLFGFNVGDGSNASADDITGLPTGWKAFNNKRADGFGRFDIVVMGTGWNRQPELSFSITGIDGDSPSDYAIESSGKAAQGNSFFAARAKGFKFRKPRPEYGPWKDDWFDDDWEHDAFRDLQTAFIRKWGNGPTLGFLEDPEDCWQAGTMNALVKYFRLKEELLQFIFHPQNEKFTRMAFFGGSTEVKATVPVPAAGWLMGGALAGLAALRRRKGHQVLNAPAPAMS